MATTKKRVGLFVDLDNVLWAAGDDRPRKVSVDQVAALVDHLEIQTDGTLVVRRAFGSSNIQALSGSFGDLGFKIEVCNPVAGGYTDRPKNASDITLVLDCVDQVLTRELDEVVVFSNDSDFVPLMTWLRSRGVVTTALINGRTSNTYRRSADSLLTVDGLDGFDPQAGRVEPKSQRPVVVPPIRQSASVEPTETTPASESMLDTYCASNPDFAGLARRLAAVNGFQPLQPSTYRALLASTVAALQVQVDEPNHLIQAIAVELAERSVPISKRRISGALYPIIKRKLIGMTSPTLQGVVNAFVEVWFDEFTRRGVTLSTEERAAFVEMIGGSAGVTVAYGRSHRAG